jgi:cell division protein FtsI (penicillin-binding protein 3)
MKDRHGEIVSDIKLVSAPKNGEELMWTIDKRLQYVAYRELKKTSY